MWPYSEKATSSINYKWAPEMNAAVSSAQAGDLGFPWQWNVVKVDHILFGNHELSFKMTRTLNSTVYKFNYLSGGSGYDLSLSPALPGTRIQRVLVNGKEVKFSTENKTESIDLFMNEIRLKKEATIEDISSGRYRSISAYK